MSACAFCTFRRIPDNYLFCLRWAFDISLTLHLWHHSEQIFGCQSSTFMTAHDQLFYVQETLVPIWNCNCKGKQQHFINSYRNSQSLSGGAAFNCSSLLVVATETPKLVLGLAFLSGPRPRTLVSPSLAVLLAEQTYPCCNKVLADCCSRLTAGSCKGPA